MESEDLAIAIRSHVREGRLPCADAFALAREGQVAPLEVTRQAEGLGTRIGWCQLGLFTGAVKGEKGWPDRPAEISAGLQAAITAALEEGRLPCARAWGLARSLGLERLDIGWAANTLGVRIVQCQLGCFA
jgi:hypothetical protein